MFFGTAHSSRKAFSPGEVRRLLRAAEITLRCAISEQIRPARARNAWLEAVHALSACQAHAWWMTTEELIALARQYSLRPRPEATRERVEENLRAMLDMLVLDLDYEREPTSTRALVARRPAIVVADLEDTQGPLH
jgi:hypothetical protein